LALQQMGKPQAWETSPLFLSRLYLKTAPTLEVMTGFIPTEF